MVYCLTWHLELSQWFLSRAEEEDTKWIWLSRSRRGKNRAEIVFPKTGPRECVGVAGAPGNLEGPLGLASLHPLVLPSKHSCPTCTTLGLMVRAACTLKACGIGTGTVDSNVGQTDDRHETPCSVHCSTHKYVLCSSFISSLMFCGKLNS